MIFLKKNISLKGVHDVQRLKEKENE